MLTYEQLFDTLRREKSRDELQVLDQGFYSAAQAFLEEKVQMLKGAVTLTSQRAQIEYENARRILKELFDRRERKILTLAMHKTRAANTIVDMEAFQEEEKQLFEDITKVMLNSRVSVLGEAPIETPAPPPAEPEPTPEPVPEPEEPTKEATESELNVTFLSPVPKFVGKDLTVFGPYEEGATATLPESVANILLKKGKVSTS